MKKLLFLLIMPLLSFGQICDPLDCGPPLGIPNYLCDDMVTWAGPGDCVMNENGECFWEIVSCTEEMGCQDLDDVFMDVLSYFDINIPLIGLFGCSQIIPILESIPNTLIDCETDLTPLDIIDFMDLTIADICECSCEEHLELENQNAKKNLIKVIDILGKVANKKGFNIEIYDDGSVEKKYVIE